MHLVYFEDDPQDRKRLSQLLRSSAIDVQDPEPPANPLAAKSIVKDRADVCILDYVLTKAHVQYTGSTLAGILREALPEHPIALLTRPGLVGKADTQALRGIFEEVIYKSELEEDAASIRHRLVVLNAGFRMLRSSRSKDWAALVRQLGATGPDEADQLLKAGPPLTPSNGTKRAGKRKPPAPVWRVTPIAHWIRDNILTFPGLTYDALYAATALGIDVKSFLLDSVQRFFKIARYDGVFAGVGTRWWRGRLFALAQDVIGSAGFTGPTHIHFASAFEKKHRVKVKQARCIVSGVVPADCVCYILKQPVKREYSFPYHPDQRPAVMDEARVSFKAIREDNSVLDEFFDDQHQKLVRALQEATE
jgi:hypothetical protein